jgi:hypothetical protein
MLTLLCLWPVLCHGAEYFVSPTGNNANPGTEASPWAWNKTWNTALSPGDIVTFLPGTYDASWGVTNYIPSGTSWAAPIVFRAKPITRTCNGYNLTQAQWQACAKASVFEQVILGGPTASTSDCRIRFEGQHEFIVMEGFAIEGAGARPAFGICVASDGPIATNPPDCDNQVGYVTPNDLIFTNFTIRNTQASSVIGHAHERVWFLASEVYNCGSDSLDHCMYFTGIDTWIWGNTFHHSQGTGSQYYRQVSDPSCYPLGDGMRIEGNVFRDNLLCGTVIAGWNRDSRFVNNLNYRNACGVSINSYKGEGHQILSNTLMSNTVDVKVLASGDSAVFQNNVYATTSLDAGATGLTFTGNCDIGAGCAQPTFVDPASGDYRLVAGDTMLIDQGQNLAGVGVTTDKDGLARPQGTAYDIGAYEYQSGQPAFAYHLSTNILEGAELAVVQGESASTIITVTRDSGTAIPVTFRASALPSGMTASFAPASCTPTVTTCQTTVTLTSTQATPEGGFTVQIHGDIAGVTRQTPVPIEVTCEIL